MASDKKFVEFIVEQFKRVGPITAKSMFGEYGLYADGKLFALICDNKLFIKPTEPGRAFIQDVIEAPPYPGAKNSFLIEDRLDDWKWLSELAKVTIKALPPPKIKKPKK